MAPPAHDPDAMTPTRETIVKLLQNIASRKELDQYLRHFCSVDSQKFAVIKVGGSILRTTLDALAAALGFLREVGLYPIVVHGAAPEVEPAPSRPDIEGRVAGPVDAQALDAIRRAAQRENLRLVDALESLGCRARPVTSGVFLARPAQGGRLGLAGEVEAVDLTAVSAGIRAGQLPIVSSIGATTTGQLLALDADDAALALALAVEPHKVVFLTTRGGLVDGRGEIVNAVNLAADYQALRAQDGLEPAMGRRLDLANELCEKLPAGFSVSITSPEHLARELFTHGGAGTLIQRGERIERHDSFDTADLGRLQTLLEVCFGRRLTPGYFESKSCYRVYVTECYRATAVLTHEAGLPYLCKFAVTTKAQGEGMGGSLWACMRRENDKLFWRSQARNPINSWYFQKADGSYKTDRWIVFWYGMTSFEEVQLAVETALALPPTLKEHGSDGEAPQRVLSERPFGEGLTPSLPHVVPGSAVLP